jgi:hypothetical protein
LTPNPYKDVNINTDKELVINVILGFES